jgi:hypothetical protein
VVLSLEAAHMVKDPDGRSIWHTRQKVMETLQCLENENVKFIWWKPWVYYRELRDQALKAKAFGRIQDRLFWIGIALNSAPEDGAIGEASTVSESHGGHSSRTGPALSDELNESGPERAEPGESWDRTELNLILCAIEAAADQEAATKQAARTKRPRGPRGRADQEAADNKGNTEMALWALEENLRDMSDWLAPERLRSREIQKQVANSDQSGTKVYLEDLRRLSYGYATDPPPLPKPWEVLILTKQARAHDERHRRATAARSRELLWFTSVLLWIAVVAFALLTAWLRVGGSRLPRFEVACAFALGGFGGILSGMQKLRDQLERLAQMDSFRAAVWAQVAAAAGLGVLALILFEANILPDVGNSDWTALVYAFLAGFSEPFAIQAVTRLAGST